MSKEQIAREAALAIRGAYIRRGLDTSEFERIILDAIEKADCGCYRVHDEYCTKDKPAAHPQRSETPQEEIARTGYLDGDHSAASSEEWTPRSVKKLFGSIGDYNAVADAHNAALAASFNRGRLEGVFMSPNEDEANYVRKLEQELAAERERRSDREYLLAAELETVRKHREELSACLEARDKIIIYERESAKLIGGILDDRNNQLNQVVKDLERVAKNNVQLRRDRKPLVEALERIAHSKPHMSNVSPVLEAKAALASVKDVMDYDTGLI